MTLYVAYDAIKMGLIKIDDAVLISKKAWATQGSRCLWKSEPGLSS